MARKIRKDVLTIDPVFLSNAEMLANRVERMELRPTKHYYQVKFIGGTALAYRQRLRGGVWFIRSRINAHAVSRSIGRADDIEPADGKTVLTYEQALAEVRRVMSGGSDALLCDPPDRASSKYLTCLPDW